HEAVVRPYYKRRFHEVRKMLDDIGNRDCKILYHSCGAAYPMMPGLVEDGMDVFDPLQPVEVISEPWRLKQDFGHKLAFLGGINVIKGQVKDGTALTQQGIDQGINPHLVINEGLVPGMDVVGELFRTNQYFIPEVLLSARTMNGSMALLRPLIVGHVTETVGVAVVGTVKGDIHDIGKNLVCMLLEAAQF